MDWPDTEWPETLRINAWTGERAAAGDVSPKTEAWALGSKTEPPRIAAPRLVPADDADPADWRHPDVGWGLVLPERPGLSREELATAADAPEPIQRLVRERNNAPVFRYLGGDNRFTLLRNYASGDQDMRGAPQGIGKGRLPAYLLLYGSPDEIPWEFQYILQTRCAVGRLSLTGQALENYVRALLSDWQGTRSAFDHAVVWAVDHSPDDISHLMRTAIAARLDAALQKDTDIASRFLDGKQGLATAQNLQEALAAQRPGLIVTTSHGQTGPLTDLPAMLQHLGLPVDQEYQPLIPSGVLANWQPDGAIWYAHACCSAGSDAHTLFEGVVEANSSADQVLKGVAGLGAHVAPLPQALLGAEKPLRAFIGHVEPTFDWTLRQSKTGQFLTDPIVRAFYNNLFRSQPIGLATRVCYAPLSTAYASFDAALRDYDRGDTNARSTALYNQLIARDLQSMVILGDPTAALPPLK